MSTAKTERVAIAETMMKQILLSLCVLPVAILLSVHSARAGDTTHEQLAHVHGLSELTIAVAGKQVEIQLVSPAINLVGFEHEASTDREIKLAEQTRQRLHEHASLFDLRGGQCRHVETSVDMTEVQAHAQHHAHHHEEVTGTAHDKHKTGAGHSDIVADYKYQCVDATALSELQVMVFSLFAGVHEMEVMWVTESGQGGARLTPEKTVIRIR